MMPELKRLNINGKLRIDFQAALSLMMKMI